MIDPKKLLLALPGEVRLPGATYAGVQLADFLGALAGMVRRKMPRSWSSPVAG